MNSTTVAAWLEHCQKMKVWIYPSNLVEQPWSFWKPKKDSDYLELLRDWQIESTTGLKIIVGKKGIRVIEVYSLEDTDSTLQNILELLGITDKEYPWVIETRGRIAVVVDTPSTSSSVFGMTNRDYGSAHLLWEGYYTLPTIGTACYFYKNRIPQEHPTQIPDDSLIKCLEALGLKESPSKDNSTSPQVLASQNTKEGEPHKTPLYRKVIKIILQVIVIWGIFILVYYLPALRIPTACIAAYIGVKMVKKE